MGTRGAWGFRYKDQDKLTYNHFDSYPDGLGADVINSIQKYDDRLLTRTAERLIVIDGETPPTEAEQKRYSSVADLGVSEQSLTDWYCLLRNGQGEIGAHVAGIYDHMYNGNEFVYDSLFCEWAYIINMDTRQLEVYKGFNQNPNAAGRYASTPAKKEWERERGYHGVELLATIALDMVRDRTTAVVLAKIDAAHRLAHPEDFDDDE